MYSYNNFFLQPRYEITLNNFNLAIDLDDIKSYLKIDNTVDDALITSLIRSATLTIEKYIKRELLTKTFKLYLDSFPLFPNRFNYRLITSSSFPIEVQRSRLSEVISIEFFLDDVLTVFDASLYAFTFDTQYAQIYLINIDTVWPIPDIRKQSVEITFKAGFGDTNISIPEDLKEALRLMIAFLYENRGDCTTTLSTGGTSQLTTSSMLIGATAILDLYRIIEI